jgi:hypothetical protein
MVMWFLYSSERHCNTILCKGWVVMFPPMSWWAFHPDSDSVCIVSVKFDTLFKPDII